MYNRGTLIRDSDESAPIHWFWQPTNPAFARSRFAHRLSVGLVIRLAERFPKQSDLDTIQCALERGEGGHAFFIKDQEGQTFREFVISLANLQGLSIDKLRSIPYWLASAIGRLFDTIWAVMRKDGDPSISRSMIRMIGREFTVNDAAARREFG
ncbi:hypothetical protein G195_000181 [Phytophthora kernoviae 00238/432]|uniref:Uncharacterized protein n=1 Tax=Phytophthora kernoviae 00238/432 TaxID=1284355 RepID=A0A8J4SDX5_9STRA|nr:hypothetical protein G195_000181 [Phytophthora kernoviae 00238/432]